MMQASLSLIIPVTISLITAKKTTYSQNPTSMVMTQTPHKPTNQQTNKPTNPQLLFTLLSFRPSLIHIISIAIMQTLISVNIIAK